VRKVISVDPMGTMTFLNDPAFASLVSKGKATITRASHVEPLPRGRRKLFQALRWLFGETGKVAQWTREWRGPWQVDLAPSRGPILGPFADRQKAIEAEITWLQDHNQTG